jgi:hypothetical protein
MEKSEPVPQGAGHAAAIIDIHEEELKEVKEEVKSKRQWKDRRKAKKGDEKGEENPTPPGPQVKGGVVKNFFVSLSLLLRYMS